MSEVQVSGIVEVFGKFAVELEDGAKLFDTHAEALTAETQFLKGAEFRGEADGFNAFAGNEGKNAKGKANIIVAYLEWVAGGKQEAPAKEEVEAKEEAEIAAVTETVVDAELPEYVAVDADGTAANLDF